MSSPSPALTPAIPSAVSPDPGHRAGALPPSGPAAGVGAEPLSALVQRGDLLAAACPSREVLKHVTSRWGVLVLMVLEQGTHRFSGLRRAIGGVSERMLAQTLQWLEGDGLVARQVHEVVPPHVDYSLTPLGRGAAERVRLLADWIEVNLPEVLAQQSRREAGAGPSDAPAGVDAAPVSGAELVAGADQPAPRPARWSDMLPAASSASAGQT